MLGQDASARFKLIITGFKSRISLGAYPDPTPHAEPNYISCLRNGPKHQAHQASFDMGLHTCTC
jgi:hypothetical protein